MLRRALVSIVVVAVVGALTLRLFRVVHGGQPRFQRRSPSPALADTAATPVKIPSPAPPATRPAEYVERHATVVLPWEAEPTPSPPAEESPPRREATATPTTPECVAIRWSSGISLVNIGQVLVEVHATNRCGRDLEPLEVSFDVAGFRHGDLVQTARGHLFDPLRRDGDGTALIALPGSADWYDRVEVRVAESGGS